MMGAAFGGLSGLLHSRLSTGRFYTVELASVGTLAGLVSITATCDDVSVWEGD